MPTDFAFRFSAYLTLLIACVCTGYSQWDYLPEVSFFTGVVAVLMLLAFWLDHRGYELSLTNANILGGAIFLIAVLWASYHYRKFDSLMNTLPWPAGGLPYLTALMMLLVPAKLFRPKHVGDWWALQGLGLSLVGSAGAMTDDAPFVLLIVLYMLAGVWSLTLFYIRRSAGHIPPPPPFAKVHGLRALFSPQTYLPRWLFVARSRPTVAEPFTGVGQPTPTERLGRSHFVRAVRWVAVAGLIALPLFLMTPRTHNRQWELFGSRMETGISSFGVDLARTGELKVARNPVFTVSARRLDGSPAVISEEQRFRVATYFNYFHPRGKWNRGAPVPVFQTPGQSFWPAQPTRQFPDLGPDAIVLEFQLDKNSFGTPIADPAYFAPGQLPPVVYEQLGQFYPADHLGDGTFRLPVSRNNSTEIRSYQQIIRPGGPDEPAAKFLLDPRFEQGGATRQMLVEVASQRIAKFARTLLDKLIREGKIHKGVQERINPFSLQPAEEDHLAIGKAIEQYLGTSGEYEYTLNLRIHDRTIDPIEDFLFNTKAGHCEKFASALMMLLRGLNIPARFVHGYRGCENTEDGVYLVRQDNAHAWVEILISEQDLGRREKLWSWRMLDATAASVDAQESAVEDASAVSHGRRLINLLITGLNSDTQKLILANTKEFLNRYVLLFALAATAVVLALGTRRYRLRQRITIAIPPESAVDPVPWFGELVELLRRHGCDWTTGQTPLEYARSASEWLKNQPKTHEWAQVPLRFAELLDSQRYAGRGENEGDIREVRKLLQQLETAIERTVPS